MNHRLWHFVGGLSGAYSITRHFVVCGEPLPHAPRLSVLNTVSEGQEASAFHLSGIVSNERYVSSEEKQELKATQEAIGRADAPLGAFIPIRKAQAWWDLSQSERRAIFEERSAHIALGMQALPQIARRLHHCRDLETPQPFDFLTWFDFKAADASKFDDLLGALRATEEWQYVDREIEIRVQRLDG